VTSSLPPSGNAYPTSGSTADDPRWRLILSAGGARALLIVFIVLGSVFGVGNVALQVGGHSIAKIEATLDIQVADTSLNNSVNTYESAIKSCNGSFPCVTQASRTLSQAFGSFLSTLDSTSVPSGAAAAKGQVVADANHCQQVFEELGTASTVAQYNQILQANGAILTVFSEDYRHLINTLE
jgi:hypothetical protein